MSCVVLVRSLGIPGVFELSAPLTADHRGHVNVPFQGDELTRHRGRPLFPVAAVTSAVSVRGALRGVHVTAAPPGRAKLVFCAHGAVQDFVVDLRVGSPTFGRWETLRLDAGTGRSIFVPIGVGHACLSLTDDSVLVHLLSRDLVAADEIVVNALDPAIGLPLPAGVGLVRSGRDIAAPTLAEAHDQGLLPAFEVCLDLDEARPPRPDH